jgi:hypothetical protein
MNIPMRPGSRRSIFRNWHGKIGGILRIKGLLMRGSGGGASNAGVGMGVITGRCFWTTERRQQRRANTRCRGIMMRHCVIGSSLLRNSVILERT